MKINNKSYLINNILNKNKFKKIENNSSLNINN
jgi:hypothetical protein